MASEQGLRDILYRRMLVLAAWLAAFVWLLMRRDGVPHFAQFLRLDFWWLMAAGAGMFGAFLALTFRMEHRLYHGRDHGGRAHAPAALPPVDMLLLLAPLLYLPIAYDAQLGVSAYRTRSLNASGIGLRQPLDAERALALTRLAEEPSTRPGAPQDVNVLDLLRDPDTWAGKPVRLSGMVFHNQATPEHGGILFRYQISCCAADAMPVGILALGHEAATLPGHGRWVEVVGRLHPLEVDAKWHLALKLDEANPIPRPPYPYL